MKKPKTVLALGNFDGVHSGHKAVILSAIKLGEKYGCKSSALLFDCHPKEYFGIDIDLLTSKSEKEELIKELGIETETLKFSEVKDMTPGEFVKKIIKGKYNAVAVCCGYNYHFGKSSVGNSEILKEECAKYSVEVLISDSVKFENKPISSSRIRETVRNGEIERANKMLLRPFSLCAEVIHGEGNGMKMGFPTMNQIFPEKTVLPKTGAYITQVTVDGKKYHSFTDVGVRPTFGEDCEKRVETYLFDFDGDLYGKNIKVEFFSFLRDEIKFSTVEELTHQLKSDEEKAKEYFKRLSVIV